MTRARNTTLSAEPLIELLEGTVLGGEHESARVALVQYIRNNAYGMDYTSYILRGHQIGSGAMESLLPVASQHRLNGSGPGWRPESAQAIVNLRMLDLVGRWDEFWSLPDLSPILQTAFRHARCLEAVRPGHGSCPFGAAEQTGNGRIALRL